MKVLVTGASGRIGANLVKSLIEREHEVTCAVLPEDPQTKRLSRFSVNIIQGDIQDYSFVEKCMEDIEAVYHLGAVLPGIEPNPFRQFDINLKGTFHMLEAASKHSSRIHRFIFASTDDLYPSFKPKYLPIDEHHPPRPYSMYSVSKLAGEDLCGMYSTMSGLRTTILRFPLTMSPGEILYSAISPFLTIGKVKGMLKGLLDHPLFVAERNEIAKSIDELEPVHAEDNTFFAACGPTGAPWIQHIGDVRDVVQGLVLALENDAAAGETIQLAGPSPFSVKEAVKYASKLTGLPYLERNLPFQGIHVEFNIGRAKAILGYTPRYDCFKMIDAADALSRGEDIGVI